MTQNPMPQIDDVRLYEKCALCHLFITDNDAYGGDNYDRDDIAEFDHLSRGDEADEAITSTHDATPSGMLATLATWRRYGPPEMIARFQVTARITWKVVHTYSDVLSLDSGLLEPEMNTTLTKMLARMTGSTVGLPHIEVESHSINP